jgi:tetratricopeptide (TPR) repeat protein
MARRWVKEELRKDEVASITAKIILFIKTRQQLVQNIGIAILSVAVLVVVGFLWWNNLKNMAMNKLDEANAVYDQGQYDQNQYKKARDLYQGIVKSYGLTESASEALFFSGNCDYNLGDYDKAIQAYQIYIKKYPNKMLTPFAYESIGICKEEKGDYKGAIDTYKELINKYSQSFLLPKIYIDLARCYEVGLKDKAEAAKQYQQVVGMYPNSVWAAKAKEILNPTPVKTPAEPKKPAAAGQSQSKQGSNTQEPPKISTAPASAVK